MSTTPPEGRQTLNGATQYATPVAAVVALVAALSSLGIDLGGDDVDDLKAEVAQQDDRINDLERELLQLRYECDCLPVSED